MTLASGTKLGPYEILSAIGAGGMGEVYRAKDTRLGRDVALKVLPEEFFEDGERRTRFEREARALATLNHPGIAAIYSFEEVSGSLASAPRHLLVMELVEGEDLAQKLLSGPLSLEESLPLAKQIAEALEAAHEKGIVHRDLKPANVKVTPDGRVKLLDFGLAKIFEGDPGSGSAPAVTQSPTLTARATAAGVILGTAAYMSPEQARGKAVDKRTDVWAFGCVLYEMLTGKRAFEGETVSDTLVSVLSKEPDWAALPEQTPGKIRDLLRRCLRREAKHRLHDIADARLELEELGATTSAGRSPFDEERAAPGPAPARAERTSRERGSRTSLSVFLPWVIAAAFAVAAGALALRARPPVSGASPGIAVRFHVEPPASGSFNGMVALSPDGSRLAFVVSGPDGTDRLFLRPLDSLEAHAVPGTNGASFPFFAPDGQRVGFFADSFLKTADLTKGSVRTLCRAKNPRGGAWSRAGVILFAHNTGSEIARVPENGGEPSKVLATSGADASLRWPSLLPDGRYLCLSLSTSGAAHLLAGALDSPGARRVAQADSGGVYSRGFIYCLREGRLVRVPFDTVRLETTGSAEPVAEDVYWESYATGYAGFAASETGVIAYLGGGIPLSRLVWYDRSGKSLGTAGPPGTYFEPDLSPDEQKLVLSRLDPEQALSSVWLLDLARGSLGRISQQGPAVTPLWRRDGKRIAYSTFPSGTVFLRDAGASSDPETFFRNDKFVILEDWAADGRLFFSALDLTTYRMGLFVRPAGGGTPAPVLGGPFSVQQARLSPDGRWLAYVSDESGIDEVFVKSYPEGGERIALSAGGGSQPRWRGDGRELFYVTHDAKMMSVAFAAGPRLQPGAPEVLFQTRIMPWVESRNHYVVTRDGQRFLVNSRREEAGSFPIVIFTGGRAGAPR